LARDALRALDAIDLIRDDAILVASELVSNAVLHAGCDPSEEIVLVARLERNALRLTITDHGHSRTRPTLRDCDYRGPGGRGLQVVKALARRWGSESRDGTLVWAELSLQAAGVPSYVGSDDSPHAARSNRP
jgi:anti-sigma regulatory factor (Ser/Thr protein kinase)